MSNRALGHHYLRAWRNYRGLSLRDLANRMEAEPGVPLMSHANIGRVEKGEQPYTQELLEAAAVALDTTVTNLLTVDPLVEDAVAQLNALLQSANRPQQEMALDLVRAMLKTGTDKA